MLPLLTIGLVAGFASGLLGIGGGVILVPALVLVLKLNIHQAITISLAAIVPIALSGFLKHYSSGEMPIKIALLVAAGGIIGSLVGASVAHMIPAETLKKIFGVVMILIGLNILFGWTNSVKEEASSNTISANS